MPQPKRQTADLVHQLDALRRAPHRDDMALARIEREARQLLSVDYGDAQMVLGLVACDKGDEVGMRTCFDAALKAGWTVQRAMNYAMALRGLYRIDEALDQLTEVMWRYPDDTEVIVKAAHFAYLMGRFRRAATLIEAYRKRMPGRSREDVDTTDSKLACLVPACEAWGLSDDRLAAVHAEIWALISESGRLGPRGEIWIDDALLSDESGQFISRTIQLLLSYSETQMLNDAMIERLAEQCDDLFMDRFVIALREFEAETEAEAEPA